MKNLLFASIIGAVAYGNIVFAQAQDYPDFLEGTSFSSEKEIDDYYNNLSDKQRQEVDDYFLGQLTREDVSAEEVSLCSDFFNQNNIAMSVASETDTLIQGTENEFVVSVENKNTFSLLDGDIYIRIVRNIEDGSEKDSQVVEQRFVGESFSLNPGEKKRKTFLWNVPLGSVSGEYTIFAYYILDKRFPVFGDISTVTDVGTYKRFTIRGDTQEEIAIGSDIRINGEAYDSNIYETVIEENDVDFSLPLENYTDRMQEISVTWRAYKEYIPVKEGERASFQEMISLNPNKNQEIDWSLEGVQGRSLIVVKIESATSRFFFNIRVVKSGSENAKISFPPTAIITPTALEGENQLFTCVDTSIGGREKDIHLIVSIFDDEEKEIYSNKHSGLAKDFHYGLLDSYSFVQKDSSFYVQAELYEGDKKIDGFKKRYPYVENDREGKSKNKETTPYQVSDNILFISFALMTVFLLIFLLFAFRKARIFVVMVLFGGLLFGHDTHLAYAQTSDVITEWREYISSTFYTNPLLCGKEGVTFKLKPDSPGVALRYTAQLENADTGEIINNGSSVPVGTRVRPLWVQNVADISHSGTLGLSSSTWFTGGGGDKNYSLNGLWREEGESIRDAMRRLGMSKEDLRATAFSI